jgi:hypothetical protein
MIRRVLVTAALILACMFVPAPAPARPPEIRRLFANYHPHAKQVPFHKSKARFKALAAGTRGGKTYACAREFIRKAYRDRAKKQGRLNYWIVAPDYNPAASLHFGEVPQYDPGDGELSLPGEQGRHAQGRGREKGRSLPGSPEVRRVYETGEIRCPGYCSEAAGMVMNMDKWDTWPPEGHNKRLENYARYRLLFKGDHTEVFQRVQQWLDKEVDKAIVYIVCNFAGLVSKICADLLFGESLKVTVGDEDSPEQEALDTIITDNNLHTKNYEMALSSSWRGDAVYKARFGLPRPWAENERVIIESVPAGVFFPHLNADNVQEMTGATLAWVKEQNDRKYLRKEIHLPGEIRNELWLLDGSKIRNRVPLSTFDEYAGLPEQQETGYPGLLVEHVPNWRLDDMFWGFSDYLDLESLFDELNNRISKISRILDKHSDPKLILPPGMMKYDLRTRQWYIEKESLQVVEIPNEMAEKDIPRYLVWDAQLEAAFKQIDKLLDLLMMMSEVSPAAFGMDKDGAAESGRALKFRLLRTLAKVNRKKLYFDQGLKNILYAAQVLDVTHGSGSYEPTIPRLEWKDGLPDDPLEQAEIEASRTSAGNTSLESSLRRLDGLDGEALTDEMERIKAERQTVAAPETGPRVTLPELGGGS